MNDFGKRIKNARKESGMNQAELQKACGWGDSGGRISHYERNFRQPSLEDFEVLARNLKKSSSYLAFGLDSNQNIKKIVDIKTGNLPVLPSIKLTTVDKLMTTGDMETKEVPMSFIEEARTDDTFILTIDTNQYQPRIPIKTNLLCSQSLVANLKGGELVLARINKKITIYEFEYSIIPNYFLVGINARQGKFPVEDDPNHQNIMAVVYWKFTGGEP